MFELKRASSLTDSDIDYIAELEQSCISEPWSKSAILAERDNLLSYWICCYIDDELVAYCSYYYIVDEYHINNIAVDSRYRRQGIARALLSMLITEAHNHGVVGITLEVSRANNVAIDLYVKHGFVLSGVRKGYYNGVEDALIYWLRPED